MVEHPGRACTAVWMVDASVPIVNAPVVWPFTVSVNVPVAPVTRTLCEAAGAYAVTMAGLPSASKNWTTRHSPEGATVAPVETAVERVITFGRGSAVGAGGKFLT